MSKSVLVTGATGFLGGHLVQDLLNKGYQVTALARAQSNVTELKKLGVRIALGDITDRLSLLKACEDKDQVYHLAGLIAYKASERALMEKINVTGTANLIDACITHQTPQVLHLSSVVAIGANFKPQPIDENFTYNLSRYNLGYFETKKRAEDLMVRAYHENQLNTYLINPSTIYGRGDATKGSRKTQVKVAQGRFPFYPPGGVSVVHVDDVIKSIESVLKVGQPARRYIVSGENLLLRELFEIIADIAGVKPPHIPLPKLALLGLGQLGELMRMFGKESSLSYETAITASLYHWFSNDRAKNELNLQPKSARLALEESVQWMLENQSGS